jgi:hypothetical protein
MEFITLHTVPDKWSDPRSVTIAYNKTEVSLLGTLIHGTIIQVDQELVDALEKIIVYQNEGRE